MALRFEPMSSYKLPRPLTMNPFLVALCFIFINMIIVFLSFYLCFIFINMIIVFLSILVKSIIL